MLSTGGEPDLLTALWKSSFSFHLHFPGEEELRKFSGTTYQIYSCGACPGPRPVQDPAWAGLGVCPPRTGRRGSAPAPQPFLPSSLGSAPTSRGPGLGAAIASAAASRALAAAPAAPPPGCWNQAPPLLLDRPIARGRPRLHPIRAGVASGRLRVPPLGLQHPSAQGPGRGGAAGREDPHPASSLRCRTSVSGLLGEAGNLNPVPPIHSGVKFPPTVFGVRKLRSGSAYLHAGHTYSLTCILTLWASSSARPRDLW